MSAPAVPAVDLERPVVVCGVGRSGTSLLMGMLNAHPALSFPPETHFFRRYVARPRSRRRLEAAGPEAFARRLAADPRVARTGLSPAELLRGEERGAFDLARTYRRLLRLVAEREGKPRVGDKDPRGLEHLPALARCFPDARVLHVVRDPRDVVLSRTKAAWSAGRPWWAHALVVREQLRRGRALGPALFGPRWLELRYEELLADPEAVLRAVCAHVGLETAPGMLEFGASAERLVAPDERAWKRELSGPLLRANAGKWRAELAPAQVRWIEAVCRESFDELGYERSAAPDGVRGRAIAGAAPLARAAAGLAYALRAGVGGRAA